MKTRYFFVSIFLCCFALQEKGSAIPAFARKYQISCQVCHSPSAPRLKGFGNDFAAEGFRMTDYESPRYQIQTGDDKLLLLREFPLAVRIDGFATYNFNNNQRLDFGSPFVVKLLSGGELSERLSYYFYFLFNERGTVAGLEDAFIMYSDLFRTGINFYIGQFQASDPLYKSELRFTLEPYKIYDTKPGNSRASLKYERGIMLEKGFSTGTSLLIEVVNGNGIGEAGEGFVFDNDKHKNFAFRISQELGKSLRLGGFAYSGREDLSDIAGPFRNNVLMYGPDLEINLDEKLIISLQYLLRNDSEAFIAAPGERRKDIETHGGFAEIVFAPKGDMSNFYLTGLLNLIDSDLEELRYKTATLHAGYMLRRNFRVVTEYTHDITNAYGKISAGFVAAF
jgi:hypothetical protein